jgi:beta-1,4-mannosyltransferase
MTSPITRQDTVRVVSSAPESRSNPYVRLFYSALRPHDIVLAGTFSPTRSWLAAHGDEFDILHVHWPEWMMRREPDWLRSLDKVKGGGRAGAVLRRAVPWARVLEFRKFLRAARAAGKRVVWTCHNLEPHEDATWPVRSSFHTLARRTDLVICHDEETSVRCRDLYAPSGRVMVMPHGNYDGVYPPARPKEEVLARVGLDGKAPLVLCIGQVRPYKATDLACEAAAELGDAVSLLIAGSAPIASYSQRIKKLVAALPNAVFVAREVTDQEFSDFVGASDIVLLPYRSVTGSGAALAALTLGRGVVASSMPFFANLLRGHPEAGRVVAPGDPHALAGAIREFLEVPAPERERAARRLAARNAWADVVPPVADALRKLVT